MAELKGSGHCNELIPLDSKEFAQHYLLNEILLIEAANVRLQLLSAMAHGIETAGALLDGLPYKAKGQGKKRFDLALKKLFPASYSAANQQINLYSQLRSHLAHGMIPSNLISIEVGTEKHLQMEENMLHISLKMLFDDYCCAIEKLIQKIDSGQLKSKKISFENLNGLNGND